MRRRAPVTALFLCGYFAIVLVWPFQPARFVWAVWPLLVLLFVAGGRVGVADWRRAQAGHLPARFVARVSALRASSLIGYATYKLRGYRGAGGRASRASSPRRRSRRSIWVAAQHRARRCDRDELRGDGLPVHRRGAAVPRHAVPAGRLFHRYRPSSARAASAAVDTAIVPRRRRRGRRRTSTLDAAATKHVGRSADPTLVAARQCAGRLDLPSPSHPMTRFTQTLSADATLVRRCARARRSIATPSGCPCSFPSTTSATRSISSSSRCTTTPIREGDHLRRRLLDRRHERDPRDAARAGPHRSALSASR